MKTYTTYHPYRDAKPTSGFEILLILCAFLFFNTLTFAQGSGQYTLGKTDYPGTGALITPTTPLNKTNVNGVTPFGVAKRDSRTQYLYLNNEFVDNGSGTGGIITHIAFKVVTLPGIIDARTVIKDFTIKIGTTTLTTLTGANPPFDAFPTNLTVSSLNITALGWVEFALTTPYVWDGNDNIVVQVCRQNNGVVSPSTANFGVQSTTFAASNTMTWGLFTGNNNLAYTQTPGCTMVTTGSFMSGGVNTSGTSMGDRLIRPDIQFTFRCEGNPPTGDAKIDGSTLDIDAPVNYCIGPVSAPNYNSLVVLGGSYASGIDYQWQRSPDGLAPWTDIPLATSATYNALKEEVDVWYRRYDRCTFSGLSVYSGAIVVGADVWNGANWTFEGVVSTEPNITHSAVFDGDFDSATDGSGDLEFCSVVVKSGTVTINTDDNLLVENQVTVCGGNLIFDNSASLIQNSTSKTINSGNVTFKRNTTKVRRYDYTYWSSPVANQNLIAFSPVTRADKYYSWNHITQDWDFAPPLTPIMTPGTGYIIRAPDDFAIAGAGVVWEGSFFGVPNNGNVNVWVSGTTDTDPLLAKWNLIGNPYPSALNAFDFFDDNSAVLDGTFYVWTHNSTPSSAYSGPYTYNYNVNDYASFNKTGPSSGIGQAAGAPDPVEVGFIPNYTVPDQYIASGQSFMIKGIQDGAPQQVIFNNTHRVENNNSNFYKKGKSTSSNVVSDYKLDRSRVWLEYINEKGGFKQLLVGYLEGATTAYDNGYDGDIMEGDGVEFFSIIKDHQLGIQGKGLPFENTDTIPIGFTATTAGNNTIALVNYDGLFKNQDVYLEDTFLNIIHNLKLSNYTFVGTVGTFLDRFVLRFTENTLNLNPNPINTNNILAFNKSGDLVVNSGNATVKSVKVYDLSGRLILQKNNCQNANVVFEKPNWNAQLVLVNITTEDNVIVTRKVLF